MWREDSAGAAKWTWDQLRQKHQEVTQGSQAIRAVAHPVHRWRDCELWHTINPQCETGHTVPGWRNYKQVWILIKLCHKSKVLAVIKLLTWVLWEWNIKTGSNLFTIVNVLTNLHDIWSQILLKAFEIKGATKINSALINVQQKPRSNM